MQSKSIAEDSWCEWWLRDRVGGSQRALSYERRTLARVRDLMLNGLVTASTSQLIDIGAGDGFIGFGALERMAPEGKVIFSDISPGLLDACRSNAERLGLEDRCTFVLADARSLDPIEDETLDIATARSVLCYLDDRLSALKSVQRVLRPGGAVSLFEVIHSTRGSPRSPELFGYEASSVPDLAEKVSQELWQDVPENLPPPFDEVDLFEYAESAGFIDIHVEVQYQLSTEPSTGALTWHEFLASRPLRTSRRISELVQAALTPRERSRLEAYLRPVVEKGRGPEQLEIWAFMRASKP